MILLWALIHSAHAAPPVAPAPVTRTVTLARPHGAVGQLRQFTVSSRHAKTRDVHVLTAWTSAARPVRRVIPASLARRIDADIAGWQKRLAPRGLASVGCSQKVEVESGPRRAPLCLTTPARRREFLSWYDGVVRWLE